MNSTDPSVTTQLFLERYFGPLAADEEIEVRSIRKEPHKSHSNFSTDPETLTISAHTRNDAGFDSYFGTLPRRAGQQDGSAKGVTRARWLWADLDFKSYAGGAEEAKRRIRDTKFWPQILVNSGGGLHAYWQLTTPIEDHDTLKDYLGRLATLLGSDRAVVDAARIMRLPGTVNQKPGYAQPTVTVAYYDQFPAYTPEQLREYLPAPEPVAHTSTYDGPSSDLRQLAEALEFIDPGQPSLDYKRWVEILMGIWDGFPGDDGLALAEHWGRGKPNEIARKWRTFEKGKVTVGTVFWEAQQRGYVRPRPTPGPVITGPRGSAPGEPVKARPVRSSGVIWLPEFLADAPEPVEWCVEGLLTRGGTSLLVSPPKVGKSFFAINMGLAVAAGASFLDRATTQGRAILFSLDMPRDPLWFPIAKLTPAYGNPAGWGFLSKKDDDALKASPFERITELIAAERPALAIIDTLQKALGIEETNNYSQVVAAMERVSQLAEETGTHIMVIHHANKGGGEGMTKILGSVGFQGAVDTIMMLQPDPEIAAYSLEVESRWVAPQGKAAYGVDDHDRRVFLIDASRDKAALHAVGQQILAYLSTCAGREAPERDLRGALLSEAGTISKALGALDAAHRISRADGKVKLFAWMPTARTAETQMELETGD